MLKWLLGREADIRAIDAEGRTVLQFAAKRGHSDVVITLLNGGADTEAIDAKGRTALHYAAGNGSENVVEMLLSVVNGNIVSTQDANGKTALDFVARGVRAGEKKYEAVTKLLIEGRSASTKLYQ